MQRGNKKLSLCIFLFILFFLISSITNVSGQSSLESFRNNPLEYWTLNNVDGTYHDNSTLSFVSTIPEYSFRKYINITGQTGAGTDYQVKITVTYDSDMQADFDDIIFVDNDEKTLLDYWLEKKTDSVSAIFWVKIIDSLESNVGIFMYYGNENAISLSSGHNTFQEFYDKDSTTGWTLNNIAVSTSGDYLRFYNPIAGNGGSAERWDILTSDKFQLMTRLKTVSLGLNDQLIIINGDDSSTHRFSHHMTPFSNVQNKWYYYDGSANEGGDWVEGNEFIFTVAIDESDSTTGIDYRRYDTSWNLLDSILNERFAYGSPIECDGIILGDASGTAVIDAYFRWIIWRKYIDTEPTVSNWGNEEEEIFKDTDEQSTIIIPLLQDKDISIKTMIEISSFLADENVTFALNTSLGIDTDFTFTYNNSYDTRLRIEISGKQRINIYRINVYSAYQTYIERVETTHIISKDVKSLIITCNNFVRIESKLTLFFMSGSVDYTKSKLWKYTDEPVVGIRFIPDVLTAFSASIREEDTFNKRLNGSFSTEFNNFQYIRCYNDIQYDFTHPIANDQYLYSNVILEIGNYTFIFSTLQHHGGVAPNIYGRVKIWHNNDVVYFMNEGDDEYITEHDVLINNFMVWRTFEDRLGVGFASDNQMFRWNNDERRTTEEFTYFYTDILSNFSGRATTHFEAEINLVDTEHLYVQTDFRQMEYEFNADFAIAEPTFSRTWLQMAPFNFLRDIFVFFGGVIGGGISTLGLDAFFGNALNFFGGIGDAIYNSLSPIIIGIATTLSPIIEGIATALSPILENIISAFGTLFDSISAAILTWAADVLDLIIGSLMGLVTAVGDFIYWFVDGIGALFGIAGFSGIIISAIVNFVVSITTFLSGVSLVIAFMYDGIIFMIEITTTYLPLLMSLAGLFVLLHVTFTIISMDDKRIMDMVGFYAKIFNGFLSIIFKIANMIIQFIGGVIP